jgi:two-component system phosphate regulon sensor histidine kinase PhoR
MVPLLTTLCIALAATLALLLVKAARASSSFEAETQRLERAHEEALRALEQERHALLNALSDAFFLVDPDGSIRFANTPGADLFRGRDILNRRIEDVFLDERLSAPVRKAIERRERVIMEVVLPAQASPLGREVRRGETAWVVDAGPIESESTPNFTRVLIRDVTAEHQTEQVRNDFVANASHELRTPLAIINGYLENLLDDDVVEDPKAARRFLKIMQKHGQRIARIVEDMLVISRLESGESGNLKMKPFVLEA